MSHNFLIMHKKFYGQKVFPWEDSSENVTSYGNHNLAYTVKKYRGFNLQNCFLHPNSLTDLTEIWSLDLWIE